MNEEQQKLNEEIALSVGFTDIEPVGNKVWGMRPDMIQHAFIPDYFNDREAILRIVILLDDSQKEDFASILAGEVGILNEFMVNPMRLYSLITATATQLSTSYLKLIKDEKDYE